MYIHLSCYFYSLLHAFIFTAFSHSLPALFFLHYLTLRQSHLSRKLPISPTHSIPHDPFLILSHFILSPCITLYYSSTIAASSCLIISSTFRIVPLLLCSANFLPSDSPTSQNHSISNISSCCSDCWTGCLNRFELCSKFQINRMFAIISQKWESVDLLLFRSKTFIQ